MRRSFVRLAVASVLTCWAIGFCVLLLYVRSLSWTVDKARSQGVFLAFQLLDQVPAPRRAQRLNELQPNFQVDFALITRDELERRVGRRTHASDQIWHKVSEREEYYFVVFTDGQSALAAGPVNPGIPADVLPIGVILAVVGLPIVAGVVTLRVERELTRVERATKALADGELSVRVEGSRGPSNELAANFNAMAERVERLVRSRDELVQAVSHELGSPLSRLRFHLELLDTRSDAQRKARLDAMTYELDALEELVAELLGYVQSDELRLDPTVFDARRGLADLAELARLEAPESRVVQVDLELSNDGSVFADHRLFQRAIENILRNAVRHAQAQVRIELTQGEHAVRVVIHDDGPGIPEPMREKVLSPFSRLDADRDRKTGGVGLGLAIVNRIVQRHGARLEIGDSPLGGAMVATWWPSRN